MSNPIYPGTFIKKEWNHISERYLYLVYKDERFFNVYETYQGARGLYNLIIRNRERKERRALEGTPRTLFETLDIPIDDSEIPF